MKTAIWILALLWSVDLLGNILTSCETEVVRFRDNSTFQYRYTLSFISKRGEIPELVSTNFKEAQIYFNNKKVPILESYRRSLSRIEKLGPGEFRAQLGRGPEDVSADNGWIFMDSFSQKMIVRLPWVSDPYTGEVLKFKEFEGQKCSELEV